MLGIPIPLPMRREMATDPFYKECARNEALNDHICIGSPLTGRLIEWEHAIIVAGRKLNEVWAILPICWWAHSGPGLVKEINVWIALNRASDDELRSISKAVDYIRERSRLNGIYGKWSYIAPAQSLIKKRGDN